MAEAATVAMTEFQAHPGETIDRSQAGPVTLTKHNRPYAVLVSPDWFEQAERALDALHGQRRVLVADALSDEDRTFVEANGPTDEEIASDTWRS